MNDDLLDLAKKSAKSTLWLTIGQGLSSTIGGLITIYISRVLKEVLFAIYSVSLIPITIGTLFANLGVANALTKYVSQDWDRDRGEISKWVSTGIVFETGNGIFISLLVVLGSRFLGEKFLGRPETVPLIASIGFMILFINLFSTAYGILNALYLTNYIAISQIMGAITRLILTVYLITSGWGVLGALLGFMSYYLVSGLLAVAFVIKASLRMGFSVIGFSKNHLEKLLRYGIPLTMNSFFQVIGINTFNALASQYTAQSSGTNPHLTSAALGNFFAANAILVILLIFNAPLLQALFPSFSRVSTRTTEEIRMVFNTSIFITALILAPVIFILMGLAEPVIFFVFGVDYELAPLYLMLLSFAYLPVILGLTPMSSFLLGMGKTKYIMIGGLTAFVIGLTSAYLLIPTNGVLGLTIVLIIFNFVTWGAYTIIIKEKYGFTLNFKKLVKLLVATGIMVIVLRIYVVIAMLPIYNYLHSLIENLHIVSTILPYLAIDILGGIIGGTVYFVSLALLRVLEQRDFELILGVAKALGPIQTPVKFIIGVMKKIMRSK